MPDEPTFLKGPPTPEAPDPRREQAREELGRILDAMVETTGAGAKPVPAALVPILDAIIETRLAVSRGPAPHVSMKVPLDGARDDAFSLGGFWLRFKVPQGWQERSRDELRREWQAAQRHRVTLDLVPMPRVPQMQELLLERAGTRPVDGYHHVQVKPVAHPSGFDAAEIIEVCVAARQPRPLRFLQVLRHPRMVVWVQLDAPDGTLAPGVSGELAAMFDSLAFTWR